MSSIGVVGIMGKGALGRDSLPTPGDATKDKVAHVGARCSEHLGSLSAHVCRLHARALPNNVDTASGRKWQPARVAEATY